MLEIHRTHRANITNHLQVRESLDKHGWSASKLWNVGLYHLHTEWDETGDIPDESALKSELKTHPKYDGLHSQSSQRVLEELAEAFNSWYGSDDERDNPPGYRKENYYDDEGNLVHEEHPRSTVTWKPEGIRHDAENQRLRLSKGATHKASPYARDYILVEYEVRPDATVETVQQVRAVYDSALDEWELHIVCTREKDVPEPPGENTAGVDLGISTFAAVAYGDEHAALYPGNAYKEDEYYLLKELAACADATSNEADRLHHARSERRHVFIHAWAAFFADRCVERDVGHVAIGYPNGIREDDDGDAKNWGPHGNLDLHSWPFDKTGDIVEYKLKARGIEVERVGERDTSKTCCVCGRADDSQRVERGLYVCEVHEDAMHGDLNGAENIRGELAEVTLSPSTPDCKPEGKRGTASGRG